MKRLLRLFPYVRSLEARLQESTNTRLEAERRAIASANLADNLTSQLADSQRDRVEEARRFTDFLASRAFGASVFGRDALAPPVEASAEPMKRTHPTKEALRMAKRKFITDLEQLNNVE